MNNMPSLQVNESYRGGIYAYISRTISVLQYIQIYYLLTVSKLNQTFISLKF